MTLNSSVYDPIFKDYRLYKHCFIDENWPHQMYSSYSWNPSRIFEKAANKTLSALTFRCIVPKISLASPSPIAMIVHQHQSYLLQIRAKKTSVINLEPQRLFMSKHPHHVLQLTGLLVYVDTYIVLAVTCIIKLTLLLVSIITLSNKIQNFRILRHSNRHCPNILLVNHYNQSPRRSVKSLAWNIFACWMNDI